MDTVGAGVVHSDHGVLCHFAFHRQAPELGVCSGNVGVNDAAGGARQWLGACAGQRSGIVGSNVERRETGIAGGDAQNEVVRRVLDHVEGHVSEVTLVADTVTAPDAGLVVPERVPGKTYAGSKVA